MPDKPQFRVVIDPKNRRRYRVQSPSGNLVGISFATWRMAFRAAERRANRYEEGK